MLRDIIKILLKHEQILKNEFDFNNIPERFMSAKLIKLIELLNSEAGNEEKTEDEKLKNNDLVLVFAFKRRTVEYLDKFFSKYRDKLPKEKKRYFECTGVTGYSSRNSVRVLNEGQSYETNPSSQAE